MPNNHLALPPTKEGARLNLTAEEEAKYKVVYKKSEKPDEPAYYFAGFWDPETDYDDNHIIVPFTSTLDGCEWFNAGQEVANILGSTEDPKPKSDSWLNIYKECVNTSSYSETQIPGCCVEKNKYYGNSQTNMDKEEDFPCDDQKIFMGAKVGGHVVKGKYNVNAEDIKGRADIAYIIPICHNHNVKTMAPTNDTGSGFYMKVSGNGIPAVKLKKFFQKDKNGCWVAE